MSISIKDIRADMNTHTLASIDGYSTLAENMMSTSIGFAYSEYIVGITDLYKNNLSAEEKEKEIQRIKYLSYHTNSVSTDYIGKRKVVGSADFDIADDILNFEEIRDLPWKPMGIQYFTGREADVYKILEKYTSAANKYNINVFTHIERDLYKLFPIYDGSNMNEDIKKYLESLVDYVEARGILLEVNEWSLKKDMKFKGNYERMKYWLNIAKDKGLYISMGSEAHFCYEVGKFDNVLMLLNEVDYPKDKILNCNLDMLNELIDKYSKFYKGK